MIAAARRQNYGAAARAPRPGPLPGMVDFCVYLLYRVALGVITALPVRFVFALGNGLGFLGWLFLPNYRRLARRNVEIAFGDEKSTPENSVASSSRPTSGWILD